MSEEKKLGTVTPEATARFTKLGWFHDGKSVTWKFWFLKHQREERNREEREKD